jgi:hypothetical protein
MLLLRPGLRPFDSERPVQHDYADDLESHFHLLLYEVVLYLNVQTPKFTALQEFIYDYFDGGTVDKISHCHYGGNRKINFFEVPRLQIVISNNKPLTQLISEMRKYFKSRYLVGSYETEEIESEVMKQFSNPSRFFEIINKALEADGWPENNKLICLFQRFKNKRTADSSSDGNEKGSHKKSRSSAYYW